MPKTPKHKPKFVKVKTFSFFFFEDLCLKYLLGCTFGYLGEKRSEINALVGKMFILGALIFPNVSNFHVWSLVSLNNEMFIYGKKNIFDVFKIKCILMKSLIYCLYIYGDDIVPIITKSWAKVYWKENKVFIIQVHPPLWL